MSEKNIQIGSIYISHQAIASVACQSALSSYGVVGLAPKNLVEGIANVILKDPTLGVEVNYDGNMVDLDLYIIIEYGTRIKSVAATVAHQVQYQVEHTIGLPVRQVNVHVRGLRISDTD
jgi:uncharacterized alkaline shock family protein YloU